MVYPTRLFLFGCTAHSQLIFFIFFERLFENIFFKREFLEFLVILYLQHTNMADTVHGAALPIALAGLKRDRDTEIETAVFEAVQAETKAQSLEARRINSVLSHMESLTILALSDFAFFDTRQQFADILGPLRTLGQRAVIECEERAVVIDGVLEQLQHAARRQEGMHDTQCMHDMQCLECKEACTTPTVCMSCSAWKACMISQQLQNQPLLIVADALSKLPTLSAITSALTTATLAELQKKFAEAVTKTNSLALSLLIADGRVDITECYTMKVLVAAVRDRHSDILRAVVKNMAKPNEVTRAAELMLIEPSTARQAAFEDFVTLEDRLFPTVNTARVIFTLLEAKSVGPGACSDTLLRHSLVLLFSATKLHALFADPSFNPSADGMLVAIETAYRLRNTGCYGIDSRLLLRTLVHYASTWRSPVSWSSLLRETELEPGSSLVCNRPLELGESEVSSHVTDTDTDACRSGSACFPKSIVESPKVEHSVLLTAIFMLAQMNHDYYVSKMLLVDPRVDVQGTMDPLYGCGPFLMSIRRGNADMVIAFLQSNRINPAANNNAALALARRERRNEIVDLLLADERVKSVDTAAAAI